MLNPIPFQFYVQLCSIPTAFHGQWQSRSTRLPAPEVSHALFERSLGTVTVLHRRCKLAEYSSQSNRLPVNTMEIRELVTRELNCILLPSFPGSSQLSIACSTEKILDVFSYHFQQSDTSGCISAITSRCPVQPAASLLSPPDVQYNQLHLLSLPDVGWNLMDPFFNSQKFSAHRCRCLHGVTSWICDSPCQCMTPHSLTPMWEPVTNRMSPFEFSPS